MTRFKMELSGMLGEFWKKQAEQELQKVKSDLDSCRITIDGDGVARNCICTAGCAAMIATGLAERR